MKKRELKDRIEELESELYESQWKLERIARYISLLREQCREQEKLAMLELGTMHYDADGSLAKLNYELKQTEIDIARGGATVLKRAQAYAMTLIENE